MIDAQGTLDHVATLLPVGCLVDSREHRPRLVRRYQLLEQRGPAGHFSVSTVRLSRPGLRAFQAAINATCSAS